jgi:fatty-acyl-CoA synthase
MTLQKKLGNLEFEDGSNVERRVSELLKTPQTLRDAIEKMTMNNKTTFSFLSDTTSEVKRLRFAELAQEAKRLSAQLTKEGVRQNDAVALVLSDPLEFIVSFLGISYLGAVAVPIYPPAVAGKIDSYIESTSKILLSCKARCVMTCPKLKTVLWSAVKSVRSVRKVLVAEEMISSSNKQSAISVASVATIPPSVSLDDVCFIQYTSGSTGDPKGVCVTHRSLFENSSAFLEAIDCQPGRDKGVSWLPLYHDMGLIGFVLGPILREIDVHFIPTLCFLKDPSIWLRSVSEEKGTITFAPNFAYGLVSKKTSAAEIEKLDLSTLRVAGCGAEPVQIATMRSFEKAFAPAGLATGVLCPSYGMAEATLAISIHSPGSFLRVDRVDRRIFEEEKRAVPASSDNPDVLEFVTCGNPLAFHEVGIRDPEGGLCSERNVGEIVFRGGSVANGYFQNPEATQKSFGDGWLKTGDLGYLVGNELVITGRNKDLIILNGRNIYPQTIEWEIEKVPGVRKGNSVVFSKRAGDSETLVCVCESEESDVTRLISEIRERVSHQLGHALEDIVVLKPGQLPKTSSGKVQRSKTSDLYGAGLIQTLGSRHRSDVSTAVQVGKHLLRGSLTKIGRSFTSENEVQ